MIRKLFLILILLLLLGGVCWWYWQGKPASSVLVQLSSVGEKLQVVLSGYVPYALMREIAGLI